MNEALAKRFCAKHTQFMKNWKRKPIEFNHDTFSVSVVVNWGFEARETRYTENTKINWRLRMQVLNHAWRDRSQFND